MIDNIEQEAGLQESKEALKFILTAYISQWTYMDNRPSGFRKDENADYVAVQLDKKELLQVLKKIAYQAIENNQDILFATKETDISMDIKHPRRMIPFLRYADDNQLKKYIERATQWTNYDVYGEEGILAKETFEQAILLNDTDTALLYAYRNNRLNEYGFLRKTKVEDLFLQVAKTLEKYELRKELEELHESYVHKLHVEYLAGTKTKKKD